jgi:hypothetical protein
MDADRTPPETPSQPVPKDGQVFQFWEPLAGRTVKVASSMPLSLDGYGTHLARLEFEDGSVLEFYVVPGEPVRLHGGPTERWSRMFTPAAGPGHPGPGESAWRSP